MNSETAFAADATNNNCSDCPICLEPMEGNEGCNWPGCSHRFCFNCVVTQVINTGIQNRTMRNVNDVANHVNCPLCRRNFRGDNVAPNTPLTPHSPPNSSPSHNPLNYPLPRSNAIDIEALTAEVQNLVQDADFDAFIRSAEPRFNTNNVAAHTPSMPINIANGRENFTPLNDGEMNDITEKLLGKFPHFQFQRISRNR